MIKIYDRKNNKIINETQYGNSILKFLYNNIFGRIILKLVINPSFSKINSFIARTKLSKKLAFDFINKYNIDTSLFIKNEYNSFNDFFTRELKNKTINVSSNSFISPAESKLSIYKITDNLEIEIKNTLYNIKELIKEDIDSSYINGNCLIFRLSVDNYHRYCYPDSGTVKSVKNIKGLLHTVSSISKDYKIYKENKRVVTKLKTDNFEDIIFIEVGALFVGDIINHQVSKYNKGDEKGYFNIGGSTIIILTKDNIKFDKDILDNTNNGIEVLVSYGEKIGIFKK